MAPRFLQPNRSPIYLAILVACVAASFGAATKSVYGRSARPAARRVTARRPRSVHMSHSGRRAVQTREVRRRPTARHGHAIRIACVGDSITYGWKVKNRLHNCWPAVLQRILGRKYRVQNDGHSGATLLKAGDVPYWNTMEFKHALAFKPKIVLIMLGTNDTKPWNWKHHKQFRHDLRLMVHIFRRLRSRPRVLICLPPPVVHDNYGINKQNMNHGVQRDERRVARQLHLKIINVFRALRHHHAWFQPDGIHPNAAGEAAIAKCVVKALRAKR